MLPDPLHPAVVHLPIALTVLLPLAALAALWAIRRGSGAMPAWGSVVALALLLTGSAWLALETGEEDEEAVEAVVAESVIHEHEEAGERFLLVAGVLTLVAGVGLVGGTLGTSARLLATVGTLGLLVAAYQVGSSGGEMVYTHGAASAYTQPTPDTPGPSTRIEEPDEDEP